MLHSEAEVTNIFYNFLPLLSDLLLSFIWDFLKAQFFWGEPEGHQCKANHLRNKRFKIWIAMARFLVHSNVFFLECLFILWWKVVIARVTVQEHHRLLSCFGQLRPFHFLNGLVNCFCDRRVLLINYVDARQVVLVSSLDGLHQGWIRPTNWNC